MGQADDGEDNTKSKQHLHVEQELLTVGELRHNCYN